MKSIKFRTRGYHPLGPDFPVCYAIKYFFDFTGYPHSRPTTPLHGIRLLISIKCRMPQTGLGSFRFARRY
jgi:hypothetical protein